MAPGALGLCHLLHAACVHPSHHKKVSKVQVGFFEEGFTDKRFVHITCVKMARRLQVSLHSRAEHHQQCFVLGALSYCECVCVCVCVCV